MRSIAICSTLVLAACLPGTAAEPEYWFEKDVAPILKSYCWKCHGGGGLAGGLDLRRADLILAGGKNGPALVPGKPNDSLMLQKILKGLMPPGKTSEENVVYAPIQTNPSQREVIRKWIKQGARSEWTPRRLDESEDPGLTDKDRNWWAFVPPRLPALPAVGGNEAEMPPVDRFLVSVLQQKGLAYARPASPRTLVTRLYLDVTGLPPSPTAMKEYLDDNRPDRYQRKVAALLADVGFGRHWGQYWLDAAGYSDVTGSDNDGAIIKLHDGKWRYRDYVINALNTNMPYDQFVLEQLAGDELSDWRRSDVYTEQTRRQLIATGFLRQAADTSGEKELNTPDIRNRVLLDTVQMVGSSLMGVTIHCAQCHSHKFDPLSQADYYRLVSIFAPALNPRNWKHSGSRHLWSEPEDERKRIDTDNSRLQGEIAAAKKQIKATQEAIAHRVVASRLKPLPAAVQEDLKKAAALPKEKRNEAQRYLVEKMGTLLVVTGHQELATAEEKQALIRGEEIVRTRGRKLESYYRIQALWEHSPVEAFYLFEEGAYDKPGVAVKAGFPRVMRSPTDPPAIAGHEPGATSSGRRTALANWLTSEKNPLTARVYVNRVWQRYFGVGLVATPDNFGRSGELPTNQALLDWLSLDFMQNGWNVKRLHQTIVSSRAYRQSSMAQDASNLKRSERIDPDNRLLWKMPLRRLEAGAIRDRALAVSGKLNSRSGGPPVELLPEPNGYVSIDRKKLRAPEDEYRHSVYVLARRNYHLTQLNVFDQPVLAHNCTRRNSSAGVAQTLVMLNSKFSLSQAEHFSTRVLGIVGQPDPASLVQQAFRIALCRPPDQGELKWGIDFLSASEDEDAGSNKGLQRKLAQLCHVLFNTNEFLYIH